MDYPDRLGLRHGELGASAFGRDWSQVPILCEVTGYAFGKATPDDLALARCLYPQSPKWPAEGSVAIKDGLGLVFLPSPAR